MQGLVPYKIATKLVNKKVGQDYKSQYSCIDSNSQSNLYLSKKYKQTYLLIADNKNQAKI